MIKLEQVSRRFGQFKAVDALSFAADHGEVLGFLGPNGAGKSTTMKMITGFLTPSDGLISVFGHDVVKQDLHAKRLIGYLPEGAPAYGDMTPRGFLKFIAAARGITAHKVEEAIDKLQLQSVLKQPIDTLSKGFKRRVGLAQAIMHDPKALILDEPTDGLDPNQKHQVRELIRQLAHDKVIIVSTHILEEVTAVCSRAIIINNGKLVSDNTPAELEAKSKYHGAVTVQLSNPEAAIKELADLPGAIEVERGSDDTQRLTVIPKAGVEILTEIRALIQQRNWAVEQIFLERGRLDEVFRRLTAQPSGE